MTHKLGGPNHVNNMGSRLMSSLLAAATGNLSNIGGIASGQQQQQASEQAHSIIKSQLLDYAKEAFDVGQEEHDRIMGEAVEEKVGEP